MVKDLIYERLERKPESFDGLSLLETNEEEKKFIGTLSTFTLKDLGIKKPLNTFKVAVVPQWFKIKDKDNLYLVDTEGFAYCRYIAKI